jgi:L-lactate utilization protein LutC
VSEAPTIGSRTSFLARVRQAVAEGNRAGAIPPLPERGGVGYQGAGADPVARFCSELTAAGGSPHIVTGAAALARVLDLIERMAAKRILLGRGPVVDELRLAGVLRGRGLEVAIVDEIEPANARETFFAADLGISGVAFAIAETGTLVMASGRADPRSLSLLPPVHLAIVRRDQLLPDLFDFFGEIEPRKTDLPACLTFITGPSKTGDIEMKLVTGVHGPGELHVVVISE